MVPLIVILEAEKNFLQRIEEVRNDPQYPQQFRETRCVEEAAQTQARIAQLEAQVVQSKAE